MKLLIVLALLASFALACYAAVIPQVRIDCGSLAGSGIVYLRISDEGYRFSFECGEDA